MPQKKPPENPVPSDQKDTGGGGLKTSGTTLPEHQRLRAALQRAAGTSAPEPTEAEPLPVSPLPNTSKFVASVCIGTLILVMFIPGGQGQDLLPPWQQLFMPGSTTFIAAIFGLFLLSLQFRAMDDYTRARWFAIVGALLLGFGFFVADAAVSGGQFGGQPVIQDVFAGGVAPAIALTLGVVPLLAALFWRTQDEQGKAAKLALGIGVVLSVFMYVAGHLVGLADDVPFALGLDAIENAPFLGDRVAAAFLLVPLALCALSPLCLIEWSNTRRVQVVAALLYWLSVVLPGVVLALYVATSEWWFWVLEPLKVMLVVATGLLLLGLGLGMIMSSVDRLKTATLSLEEGHGSGEV